MLYDAVMAAQTPLAAALERVGDRWSLLLAALPPRTAGAPLTRPWRKFRSIPHGRSQIGCASSDPRSDPLCSPTHCCGLQRRPRANSSRQRPADANPVCGTKSHLHSGFVLR